MKTFYTAYTKQVQDNKLFFVKRFLGFPDLPHVDPIMEGFGMHADFDTACKIAGVQNEKIKQQLMQEIESMIQQAKVIDINNEMTLKRIAL